MFVFNIFIILGCAMSGLIADSRTMVDKARVEAQVFAILQQNISVIIILELLVCL